MANLWIEYGDDHGDGAARWGAVSADQVDAVLASAVDILGQPDTVA